MVSKRVVIGNSRKSDPGISAYSGSCEDLAVLYDDSGDEKRYGINSDEQSTVQSWLEMPTTEDLLACRRWQLGPTEAEDESHCRAVSPSDDGSDCSVLSLWMAMAGHLRAKTQYGRSSLQLKKGLLFFLHVTFHRLSILLSLFLSFLLFIFFLYKLSCLCCSPCFISGK